MTAKLRLVSWLDHHTRFLGRHPVGVRLRHTLRGLAGRAGSFGVIADGLAIEGDIGDRDYLRYLAGGGYETLTVRMFRDAIRRGMAVADIGAHIGYFTLIAARLVGSEGRVWAFEPNPDSLRFLRHNVERNSLGDRTVISAVAASNVGGSAQFHLEPGNRMASSLFVGHDFGCAIPVDTGRLDDLIPGVVDVMKMDVEGGEIRALQGMPRILSQLQILLIELNPPFLRASGCRPDEVLELLETAGLQAQVVDESRHQLRPLEASDVAGDHVVNLYASRCESQHGSG